MEVVLGHGASGSAASMEPWVDVLSSRGISARAIELRPPHNELSISAFAEVLDANPEAIIGGHSFGGRMATVLASRRRTRALILLSYPLHRPGKYDDLRADHWPHVRCPALFLSGDRDPFARIDLLMDAMHRIPSGRLIVYPKQRHGLLPVREEVGDEIARFIGSL